MFHDPVTGDQLSRLEFYTRTVQTWVRTPWFILAFNVITILALALGHPLEWNDFASWLAVIIEWLVGTYMFGQTARDAVHIRRIAHLEEVNEVQLRHLEKLLEASGLDPSSNRQTGLHREAPKATERLPDTPASYPGPGAPGHRQDDGSPGGASVG